MLLPGNIFQNLKIIIVIITVTLYRVLPLGISSLIARFLLSTLFVTYQTHKLYKNMYIDI